MFGVDLSSSTKIDHREKDILILGKDPIQGLEHTLSAEKMYLIKFTDHNKKICLSLHYFGANNYLFGKGAITDMRYFERSKLSRSLVHKKKLSLI